ncbi:AraC family transcriptional regulator [Microbacterium sp. BK668]|uniref:helix-turn-helix transcriptional regulator n=1 Tax=Microbacterium sp. BK668 TaxID=2512118 RepID=UPI0010D1CF45|nr:AraC family transcriptional regulator [Microbacterium sp. BK668]TDN90707.1 AraC-like DNA-binding protein [Microbacterium sp. BK668]
MSQVLTLESRDGAAVEETWRRFVPSAKLHQVDPRTFEFDWTSITLDDFSVVRYELAASVQSAIEPSEEIMACRVAVRDGWVRTPRRDLNARLPWLSMDGPTTARWNGRAQVRAFVFDREFAQRFARRASGDDRLVLRTTDASPRTPAVAEQWERTFQHVSSSLLAMAMSGGIDPLMEAELRRHALRTTLAVFPTTFLDALDRTAQRTAAPRTVRRAIAYIDEHAREPITVDDIAAAVSISTRGLQYAFKRALGVTPTEYLRGVRLDGAHVELKGGAAASITDIARRWGFAGPSKFAKYYREAYGRNPRDTVRMG